MMDEVSFAHGLEESCFVPQLAVLAFLFPDMRTSSILGTSTNR